MGLCQYLGSQVVHLGGDEESVFVDAVEGGHAVAEGRACCCRRGSGGRRGGGRRGGGRRGGGDVVVDALLVARNTIDTTATGTGTGRTGWVRRLLLRRVVIVVVIVVVVVCGGWCVACDGQGAHGSHDGRDVAVPVHAHRAGHPVGQCLEVSDRHKVDR